MTEGRWRVLLLTICAVSAILLFAEAADTYGLGAPPWEGFGDEISSGTDRPFVLQVHPVAGGATWRAGVRDGDRVDLREQMLDSRLRFVTTSWLTTRPTVLTMHRGQHAFTARIVGSPVWEGDPLKLAVNILVTVTNIWFLGCALLISRRRAKAVDARLLVLVLLAQIAAGLGPANFEIPDANLSLLLLVIASVIGFLQNALLIVLSSRFGVQSLWRRLVEWFAYCANAAYLGGVALAAVGFATLRVDPWPYYFGVFWGTILPDVATAAVLVVAALAVASSPRSERPRCAWLLLPLPAAFAFGTTVLNVYGFALSYHAYFIMLVVGDALLLLGAFAVSYALLNRRVLDIGFVMSRTVVVAGVSLVVVAAFVLLEFLLGTVLASASHITGLVANAALALVLGVSLRSIHRRIDEFVDRWMFRKRYEDERALRDFSTEAGFVTERNALLDQALGKIRDHTDARAAALFVRENGVYKAARHFGDGAAEVDVNDPAILALEAWHKPVDPHRYATELKGDLALPMVARGKLLGLLVCGERAGGEAYAPDDIAALSEFTRGIGSAFDALSDERSTERSELMAAMADLRNGFERLERRLS